MLSRYSIEKQTLRVFTISVIMWTSEIESCSFLTSAIILMTDNVILYNYTCELSIIRGLNTTLALKKNLKTRKLYCTAACCNVLPNVTTTDQAENDCQGTGSVFTQCKLITIKQTYYPG